MRTRPLLLTLFVSLLAHPALAADLTASAPVYKAAPLAPVPFTWTGFYLGGFVGGSGALEDPVDINNYGGQGIVSGVDHHWFNNINSSVIGGGTIGYNYQIGAFVAGLEGELGYLHLVGSGVDNLSPGPDVFSASRLGDWYGIAAGRLGVTWDRALFYVKAGGIFTQASATITDTCTALPCGPRAIVANGSTNIASWVAGGGIEYAFDRHWSIKGEYLYSGLGQHFLASGVANDGFTYNFDNQFTKLQIYKFGVNYRF